VSADHNHKQSQSIQNLIGFSEYSPKIKPLAVAEKCCQLGLSAFQLTGDYAVNFPENITQDDRREVKEFIQQHDIHLHYHAPSDIPLASRHKQLRLGGLERLAEFIELAVDMGAVSFIFHPGRFAFYKIDSGQIMMATKNIPESYFERFYDSVLRLAEYADKRINLLLENTHRFNENIIKVIDKFLNLPFTGLVWDIGHMHAKSNSNQSNDNIADFFSDRLRYIKLAHIHGIDNKRGHLPLGSGSLDFRPYIDILKSLDIEMIIEVYTDRDLQKSLQYVDSIEVNSQV